MTGARRTLNLGGGMRAPLIAALIALTATGAAAQQGPFGVKKGMTRSDIEKLVGRLEVVQPGMFRSEKAPNPHRSFEGYLYLLTPQHGLCKVVATGVTVRSSSGGAEMRAAFNSLSDALTERYGLPSTAVDRLQGGSIWRDPGDWMMALYQKERTLQSHWQPVSLNAREVDLQAIMLETKGLSSSSGWLTLSYEFTNAGPCLTEIRRLANSPL